MALDEGSGRATKPPKAKAKATPPPPPVPHAQAGVTARPARRYPWLHIAEGVDWRDVNPTLLERMNLIGRLIGKPITIISGFRSHAEQRVLYARYQSGQGGIAAQPGHSYHEVGKAVDALVDGQAIANVVPQEVFQQVGVHSLGSFDAPHVQLEEGAAMSGPQGGATVSPAPAQGYSGPRTDVPVASGGFSAPPSAPPASADTLPFEIGAIEPVAQQLLSPAQIAQTWAQIAQLPGASPETIIFAQRMAHRAA